MRRSRASYRRPTGRSNGRNKEWTGFSTSPSGNFGEPGRIVLDPGDAFIEWLLDPDDALTFYDEPTIIRMLISDQCHAVAPNSAASISCSLYVGICVGKSDIATPPNINPEFASTDFMYWNQWMMFNGGTTDGFINVGPTRNGGDTIDLKSKRKLEAGNGLLITARCPVNNSHPVVWAWNARILLLNH